MPVKTARKLIEGSIDDNLVSLIERLTVIDVTNPIAKLNETSISDNNGRRIRL